MKKLKFLFIFVLGILILFAGKVYANDLDVIDAYTIYVDPREDGSLDIKYNIKWRVLDSTTQGPLEWVRIGIPNKNVDNIKALGVNIKKIKYDENQGNTYVRIDLNRDYVAGEVVNIAFSIHQSHMYLIKDDDCTFYFTPGWFDDIDVKSLKIYWAKDGVKGHNSKQGTNSTYVYWSTRLSKGQSFPIRVTYDVNYFPTIDRGKQVSNAGKASGFGFGNSFKLFLFVMAIIILIFVYVMFFPGYYYPYRGYGYWGYGWYHHYPFFPHNHYGGFFGGGGRRRRFWWK